jgi:hypothetical protein
MIHPKRLLVVLDEFSALCEKLSGLQTDALITPQVFGFLSNTIQSTEQLSFTFTGTYVLLEMMRDHAFDLAKICTPRLISFLDETSARQLVLEPVALERSDPDKGWLEYDERVVDRIVTVTNRHPYLIQYLCMLLVDRMNVFKFNSVNLNDINSIIADVVSKPAHEMPLLTLWKEFDTVQHKVLSVIASLSTSTQDWVSVDEIASTFSDFRDSIFVEDILKVCSSLADAELLERTMAGELDTYRITVPLYQMWLKQNRPVMSVFS